MRRAIILSVVLALVACTASSSTTGTTADEQAIRDSGGKWAATWNQGDAKAMGALLTDDYESIDASAVHTQGRAAFEAAMSTQFATRPAGLTMTITTGYVKWLSATSAVSGGGWSISGATPDQSSRGTWIGAYQKRGGVWLLASGFAAPEPPSMPMASDTAHIK